MKIPKEIYQFHAFYAGLPTKERNKKCSMTWNEIREMLKDERTELNISWSLMLQLMKIAEEEDVDGNDELIALLIECYKKSKEDKIK